MSNSVERVLSILELVSKNPKGITLGEIYRTLKIPKSTAYDILQALYKADAVYYKDEKNKSYVIGSKMYAIGSVYTKNSSLLNVSQPLLEEYSEKYQLITFISKRIDEKIISVFKYEPSKVKILMNKEGSELTKLHSTAIGKVFLAFDNYPIPNTLLKYTNNTITNKTVLEGELEKIKDNGYSVENMETEEHIKGYGIPIYNFENRVVGCISTYGLSNEMDDKNIIDDFIKIAKEISSKLGYYKE